MLRVSDTGNGMDQKTIARIFDPFFTTKEKFHGTGLGLSMVFSIVHQYGGFIEVFSQPGIGSNFMVYFPVIEFDSTLEKVVKLEEEIPTGTGLILVIDDEEIIRQTAESMLIECGYNVILAADGEEGCEIFREKKSEIKMVILDMSMPKISGKDTYLKLKEIYPPVKVLLTSGFRQDERVQEVINFGVTGFIQKPFSLTELAKKIKEII
jgi:CheY-like chemotaxis protein